MCIGRTSIIGMFTEGIFTGYNTKVHGEGINTMDQSLLERRYHLRKTRYISERFEISPNITEQCSVSDNLHISHAARDASILPLLRESYLRAYEFVKDWFDSRSDIALALWVAPEVSDLRYMICLPCDEGFFCAPGSRDGMGIILFASPRAYRGNADPERLSGLLAHEITHHLVRALSHATDVTMKRKEKREVPMWLEEGLCQLIQGEIDPAFRRKRDERISVTTTRYNPAELWDDLSGCRDVPAAYMEAYRHTRVLLEAKGRPEVIRLLHLHRSRDVDWNDLLF